MRRNGIASREAMPRDTNQGHWVIPLSAQIRLMGPRLFRCKAALMV